MVLCFFFFFFFFYISKSSCTGNFSQQRHQQQDPGVKGGSEEDDYNSSARSIQEAGFDRCDSTLRRVLPFRERDPRNFTANSRRPLQPSS